MTSKGIERIFWNGWFSIEVPTGWVTEEVGETISLHDAAGVGSITASLYKKSSDDHQLPVEMARGFAKGVGISEQDIVVLLENRTRSILHGTAHKVDAFEHWRIGFFQVQMRAALFSYNSSDADYRLELELVDRIFESFRWEPMR